jgi:hypothetical protein
VRIQRTLFLILLSNLEIGRAGFTGPLVRLNLERDFLTFIEITKARALKRAHMDEYVLAAVIGLDEAIALLAIVPFYDAHAHGDSPFASDALNRGFNEAGALFEFWGYK